MFNWLKKIFKKPEEVSRLTIEMLPDGNIVIDCKWPNTHDNKELVELAKRYAGLIYMLNTGRLASILNDAIAVNGHEQGKRDLAQLIIKILHDNMPVADKHRPLIGIHEAFLRGGTD